MVSTAQQSISHNKKSSTTKFSNYVSSSNNLTPTPNASSKAY